MTYILEGRNIDYIASGMKIHNATYLPSGSVGTISGHIPIIRQLPFNTCLDTLQLLEFQGARHINYIPQDTNPPNPLPTGIPIVATSMTCCDAVSEEARVQQDCYPATGIIPKMVGHFLNITNCQSAAKSGVILAYDPGSLDSSGNPQWGGSIGLRGGGLSVYVACQSGIAIDSPLKFRLTLRGCTSGEIFKGYECSNPLLINFGNLSLAGPMSGCCDCTRTTDAPDLNLYVATNCNPTVFARHIGYDFSGVPIVAKDQPCPYSAVPFWRCNAMTCGLTAIITNVNDCTCMAGTYNMTWGGVSWDNISIGTCTSTATMTITCTDDLVNGRVTLTVNIVCGADNIGTGSITIDAIDLDYLDETVIVNMTGPYDALCGTCTFQWNAMAMSWSDIGPDACTGICTCPDPLTLLPGTVDGEIRAFNCNSAAPPPCCIGSISVRIMR